MRTVSIDPAVHETVNRAKPWSDPLREDEPDPELANGLMYFMNLQCNSIIGYIYDAEHSWRPINNPNNANEEKQTVKEEEDPFSFPQKKKRKETHRSWLDSQQKWLRICIQTVYLGYYRKLLAEESLSNVLFMYMHCLYPISYQNGKLNCTFKSPVWMCLK